MWLLSKSGFRIWGHDLKPLSCHWNMHHFVDCYTMCFVVHSFSVEVNTNFNSILTVFSLTNALVSLWHFTDVDQIVWPSINSKKIFARNLTFSLYSDSPFIYGKNELKKDKGLWQRCLYEEALQFKCLCL